MLHCVMPFIIRSAIIGLIRLMSLRNFTLPIFTSYLSFLKAFINSSTKCLWRNLSLSSSCCHCRINYRRDDFKHLYLIQLIPQCFGKNMNRRFCSPINGNLCFGDNGQAGGNIHDGRIVVELKGGQ